MPQDYSLFQVFGIHIMDEVPGHGRIIKNLRPKTAPVVSLIDQVDFKSLGGVLLPKAFPIVGHPQKAVKYDQGGAAAQDI
jgi:hypothetical protein